MIPRTFPLSPMRRRRIPLALATRRLAALLEPRACADTSLDVETVLTACYRKWASSIFTVDDVRVAGLVAARDTRAFGRALSLLAADGLPIAGLVVVRRETADRRGRYWQLRPAR